MSSELPHLLRDGTREWHSRAERSGAMAALLAGRLPREGYLALLLNLRAIYAALESALADNAGQAWLAGLELRALARSAALEADLAGFHAAAPLPATTAYAERLHRLGRQHDAALLAHAYTRYLGDLHGGQILRRVVHAQYPGIGTAFHDFGTAEHVLALRGNLRTVLAAAPAAASARIVEEACWSFAQHVAVFEALLPHPPAGAGLRR
jgi:heme oxygenase (biliverdin-producing, ferredoxin)